MIVAEILSVRKEILRRYKDQPVAEDRGHEEQNSEDEGDQGLGFTPQPDYRAPFSTFYANVALISHTGDDLGIDFCLVAPPHNVHGETQTISVPVMARVMTSPGLADGLIQALRTQLAKQSSERAAGRSTSCSATTMSGEALSRIVTPTDTKLTYHRKQLTLEELRARLHQRTPVVPNISPAEVIRELRDEP